MTPDFLWPVFDPYAVIMKITHIINLLRIAVYNREEVETALV